MKPQTDYLIMLWTADGTRITDPFLMRDLPTSGLQFETGGQRWRVTAVAVVAPASLHWDTLATDVNCTVAEAAHWDKDTECWKPA